MKPQTLILAALLLTTLATATPLQTLLNTYSFDYNDNQLTLTNPQDHLNNSNIVFQFQASSKNPGIYKAYIDLSDTSTVSASSTTDIGSVTKTIKIPLSTNDLSGKTQFNYTLRIYDSNETLVYRKSNLQTSTYPDYETGYTLLGFHDSNIDNNKIRLEMSITSSIQTTKNITIFLEYGGNFISATEEKTLSVGPNQITIDISGETLSSTHHTGPYNISGVLVGEKFIPFNHTTSIYDFKDFATKSYLDSFSSSFVDSDNNNLTDYLKVDFGIKVLTAGEYRVEADIYDLYSHYLFGINETDYLDAKNQMVETTQNAKSLYSLGLDGPYVVDNARLFLNGELIDTRNEVHITSAASYSDFERPNLPDLNISMKRHFENVTVVVENIGQADAFSFDVVVFDLGDFEIMKNVGQLNAGQNYSFSATLENINESLTGVVDFEDLVEEKNESNNVYVYSLNEEDSFSIFDFKDKHGRIVASFDSNGNLNLKGSCFVSKNCIAENNSLVFQNTNNETVAHIDEFGNLCLEGIRTCENFLQSTCNPTITAFIIQNSQKENLSYIDFAGNLCLTGKLHDKKIKTTSHHRHHHNTNTVQSLQPTEINNPKKSTPNSSAISHSGQKASSETKFQKSHYKTAALLSMFVLSLVIHLKRKKIKSHVRRLHRKVFRRDPHLPYVK